MTEIRLYNTLTRQKDVLTPADKNRVTMYVCGPTVYNRAHIGNARPAVVFDVLFRLLRHTYGETAVHYARNFTDIDDKIMAAAEVEGVPIDTITKRYEDFYSADMGALGVLRPTYEPRATEHVQQMVAMIEALIAKGAAYAADGHALFDITKDAAYGTLSRRPMDEMIAGARVEVAPYKKNPGDFVLWKPSAEDQPGWPSPWGRGRPGWHIECSAMIEAHLGTTIDIHAGGLDLQFPHHENECAQSRCAHDGAPLANIWMHNGFLSMDKEKMSKSLGNVVTVGELLEQRNKGETLRLALLMAHYRQPLDWNERLIEQARAMLDGFANAIRSSDAPYVDAEVPAAVLCREPLTKLKLCPIVTIGQVTIRTKIDPPKHWDRPTLDWFMAALEALGDAAIETLDRNADPIRLVDAILARLDALPDHEKLHQELAHACRETARAIAEGRISAQIETTGPELDEIEEEDAAASGESE